MRRTTILAVSLLGLYVILAVTGLLLLGRTPAERIPEANEAAPVGGQALFALTILVFAGVGALIAVRLPRHPIGWLLCGVGVLNGLYIATDGYANLAVYGDPGSLAGGPTVALTSSIANDLQWWLFLLILLLFPDGRLPSRRWRPVGAGIVLLSVASALQTVLQPGPSTDFLTVDNPFGLEGAGFVRAVDLDNLSTLGLVPVIASLAVRWYREPGAARQQLKPILLAATLTTGLILLGTVVDPLASGRLFFDVMSVLIVLSFTGLGAAIAVSVLRYRLYDIDVVINRALVYAALTACLVGVYLLGVVGLGALLRPLVGDSDLAVAGSTLFVAALFRPLRLRIQRAVDRRFYRRKYDAERTLEGFGRALRDRVDLPGVCEELHAALRHTVAPTGVGVWLQSDEGGPS